ncbi:MAG: metallophosphoesterase [Lachnospiraceae bacterium]|nr:metallophosphoesterase [Lachnospiraceae bacterium]
MLAICLVILISLLTLFVYVQSRGFTVVRYRFVNKKLKVDHFRFAVISDLHDQDHGNGNEEVLKAIEAEKPDAVFLAGDMITSSPEPRYRGDRAVEFIKALADKYPLYYGIGNHEEKLKRSPEQFPGEYERFTGALEKAGVRMLINEKVSIDEAGIDVYGLDLEHEYFRKIKTRWMPDDHLMKKFGECDESRVSILIAHNPDQFEKYVLWHPDYILSGHVHGGIINIPPFGGVISPQLKIFPKYDAGLYEKDGSTMILSRGLGTHTIPVRIFNKAEVVIVDLYNKEDIEDKKE